MFSCIFLILFYLYIQMAAIGDVVAVAVAVVVFLLASKIAWAVFRF